MLHGSCLCNSITYTLSGVLRDARYCHCRNCRKFSGSAIGTWAIADASQLSVQKQTIPVTRYDSGRGIRCFCSKCGSPVWFESTDNPETLVIPLGALDSDNIEAPGMHIYAASQPAWSKIRDGLPTYDTYPQ